MIKAIIFDCFGVLTSDGWLEFVRTKISDPDKQQLAHDLNKQANIGSISYKQFVDQVAVLAGLDAAQAHIVLDTHVANSQLFSKITELKSTYKIGVLSNASEDWMDVLFTEQQRALFDGVVLSFEVGAAKPHPKAYHAICDKLHVLPQEAIFVDDIERYATGAKDIGMKGVWFRDNQQLFTELEMLLATDSNS